MKWLFEDIESPSLTQEARELIPSGWMLVPYGKTWAFSRLINVSLAARLGSFFIAALARMRDPQNDYHGIGDIMQLHGPDGGPSIANMLHDLTRFHLGSAYVFSDQPHNDPILMGQGSPTNTFDLAVENIEWLSVNVELPCAPSCSSHDVEALVKWCRSKSSSLIHPAFDPTWLVFNQHSIIAAALLLKMIHIISKPYVDAQGSVEDVGLYWANEISRTGHSVERVITQMGLCSVRTAAQIGDAVFINVMDCILCLSAFFMPGPRLRDTHMAVAEALIWSSKHNVPYIQKYLESSMMHSNFSTEIGMKLIGKAAEMDEPNVPMLDGMCKEDLSSTCLQHASEELRFCIRKLPFEIWLKVCGSKDAALALIRISKCLGADVRELVAPNYVWEGPASVESMMQFLGGLDEEKNDNIGVDEDS